MNSPSRRCPSPVAGLLLLVVTLTLAACGGGGGGGGGSDTSTGSTRDHAASQALVDEGVSQLQDIASAGTLPPFATIADLSTIFGQAAQLDPENPTAAFFNAIGQVFLFLDSPEGAAFLSKVGWQDFRENEVEWEDFVTALGDSAGSVTGTTGFILPINESDGQIVFGQGGLTFAEIIEFFTVTMPTRLHTSVDLLGTIPPDWSFSLTFTPPATAPAPAIRSLATGNEITITVNYTDAMALRAVFAGLETVLAGPGIWNYTGLDAFIAAHTDEVGAFTATDQDLKNYFASADQPLSNNAVGVERVLTALTVLADSFDKAISSQQTDTSDHLFSVSGLFANSGRYDAEPEVLNYGLNAFRSTAADVKAALTGASSVGVYQPVAFIDSFDTCEPVLGAGIDYSLLTIQPANAMPGSTASITQYVDVSTLDGAGFAPGSPNTGSDYFFRIILNSAANLSIWTSDGTNTVGAVAYESDGKLTSWDSDDGAADGSNFGISIAAAYFAADYHGFQALPDAFPLTLWVRVTGTDTNFQLHVLSNPTGSANSPIFLKGGGGRWFQGTTYRIGQISNVNLGNLVRLLGNLWDLSDRSTLLIDTAQTIPITQLKYDAATVRANVLSVLPGTTFSGPLADSVTGPVDILTSAQGISPPDFSTVATLTDASGPVFCAYPGDLMQARLFVGGHSIGVGF